MAFLIDSIRRSLRENARKKRVQVAARWPQATAKINLWKILPAGDAAESFTQTDFIEAGFSFLLNGEYYGGYVRSVAMGRREAEKLAVGGTVSQSSATTRRTRTRRWSWRRDNRDAAL